MFWQKVFHVLVVSVLLMGGLVVPFTAVESQVSSNDQPAKPQATSYTVCASGCDFKSIQTAIDSVGAGDTLNLAAETFTESIMIDKDLTIQGTGAKSTIVQAATAPDIATNRVVTVAAGVTVTIENLTIRHGKAEGNDGGGILSSGNLTLNNSTVSNNVSYFGAGIANGNDIMNISNCTIINNTASDSGGGIGDNGIMNIFNTSVISNTSSDVGGGIISGGTLHISNSIISSNRAVGTWGGGIFIDGTLALLNSLVISNTADNGGGVYSYKNSDLTLTNVTISGNTAANGGGIYHRESTSTLTNVILWSNMASSGEQIYNDNSMPSISYSDIQGSGGSGVNWDSSLGADGGGNIDSNPLFIDAANSDLRLGEGSPAIDAGDNSALPSEICADLGGFPRYWDVESVSDSGNGTPPIIDIGAFEYFDGPKIFLPIVTK